MPRQAISIDDLVVAKHLKRGEALPRPSGPSPWGLASLAGRLVEISAAGSSVICLGSPPAEGIVHISKPLPQDKVICRPSGDQLGGVHPFLPSSIPSMIFFAGPVTLPVSGENGIT